MNDQIIVQHIEAIRENVPLLEGADLILREATAALVKIGVPAVPALIASYGEVRATDTWEEITSALIEIGVPALPTLIEALNQETFIIARCKIAHVLGEIGHTSAIPALLEALKEKDNFTRLDAAAAIIKIDKRAAIPVVPVLIAVIEDRRDLEELRSDAASALSKIGDMHSLPRKIIAYQQFSPQERINILGKLRRIRYKDKEIRLRYDFPDTRTLCRTMLIENDAAARAGAQTVLNWLNGDNQLLRPALRDKASDSEELLRAAAASNGSNQSEELLRASNENRLCEAKEPKA